LKPAKSVGYDTTDDGSPYLVAKAVGATTMALGGRFVMTEVDATSHERPAPGIRAERSDQLRVELHGGLQLRCALGLTALCPQQKSEVQVGGRVVGLIGNHVPIEALGFRRGRHRANNREVEEGGHELGVADPQVVVGRGNHGLVGSRFLPLRTWFPVEVLHFPLRSRAQWTRKVELQGEAFTKHIERAGTGYHLKGYDALRSGEIEQQHRALVVDDDAVERGLADGTLAVDTRLRDALWSLRDGNGPLTFPEPGMADDATYAVEAAVLGEADVIRVERRLDAFEQRLRLLERRR